MILDAVDFKEVLHEALFMYMGEPCCSIKEISTREKEGLLSINENMVVKMQDGSEFEVVFIKRK